MTIFWRDPTGRGIATTVSDYMPPVDAIIEFDDQGDGQQMRVVKSYVRVVKTSATAWQEGVVVLYDPTADY
jgi:hypothetical protein